MGLLNKILKISIEDSQVDEKALELGTLAAGEAAWEKLMREHPEEAAKIGLDWSQSFNGENAEEISKEFVEAKTGLFIKFYGNEVAKLREKLTKILADFLE